MKPYLPVSVTFISVACGETAQHHQCPGPLGFFLKWKLEMFIEEHKRPSKSHQPVPGVTGKKEIGAESSWLFLSSLRREFASTGHPEMPLVASEGRSCHPPVGGSQDGGCQVS